MLETSLITFREGLEAFLIVAIALAFINKMGYFHLRLPVYLGIGAALLISATTGWHVAELAQDPIWEGSFALIAGLMVASFTMYVMRTAKTIRSDIHARIQKNADINNFPAQAGVFIFIVLMIAREGMETALMLGTLSANEGAVSMWAGALTGLGLVAGAGYLWATQYKRINLKLFMQVTGIFLVLFSVHLFLYGLHELSEMEALPLSEDANYAFHNATEIFDGDQLTAKLITYSLLLVPCAWLGFSFLKDKFGNQAPAAAE